MANLPTYEEMTKKLAEKALDGYVYKDKTLREWINIIDKFDFDIDKVTEALLEQTRWIPCSERLPEEDGRYFVTRYDYVTDSPFVDILWYEKRTWWDRRIVGDFAVNAWMPLPEPYEEVVRCQR